jgi:hypothetical protein
MTLPPPKVSRRICQLFAMLGSLNAGEAESARDKLTKLLARHNLSWNDLPTILAASNNYTHDPDPTPPSRTDPPSVNALDLVLRLIEMHLVVSAEERMAIALWVLHTYVYDRYTITPRLALLSPVRGCGKTTALVLIDHLIQDPYRTDNTTPAAIYYQLDHHHHTAFLIDEGDNLDLLGNCVLRSVFNSGHRRGGNISRFVSGRPKKFVVFAPLAVAAIGTLPLPLMHRSITISMRRQAGENVQRLNEDDGAFPASRGVIQQWAATCALSRDPEMPQELTNRAADNWRVLLAIADSLGHGEDARAAAIALSKNHLDEDPGIVLLRDIQTVFLSRGVDRIASAALALALCEIEDGLWHDWRGPRDDRPPRKLTQGELSRLLRPFGIRPRTVWPAQRRPGDESSRGYYRSQFEMSWRAYCSPDTPTHARKIRELGSR